MVAVLIAVLVAVLVAILIAVLLALHFFRLRGLVNLLGGFFVLILILVVHICNLSLVQYHLAEYSVSMSRENNIIRFLKIENKTENPNFELCN